MKTYCISDIHAHYSNLINFISTLSEDDSVYVLGDVIDKGPDAIKCLTTIMHDKRFHMLLGNHEYMMYKFLLNCDYYSDEAYAWLELNSGDATFYEYQQLSKKEQKEIFDYISKLPLNYPNVKVNKQSYYLVHAFPVSNKKETMKSVKFNDDIINQYVWTRIQSLNDIKKYKKKIITGHTMIQNFKLYDQPYYDGKDIYSSIFIDIDGGLAGSKYFKAKLIALCLDDLSYKLY